MKKVKLGDLGKIITGNTPSKKTLEFYDSNDIPFIKPDDFKTIDEISSSKGNKNYVSENARNSARIVPQSSVLVTCIGIIGKVMISESELSFNQQINAIVPNELILSKYLAYLLLYNKPKLDFISNAPVVPIINKTQFSEFEVTFHEDIDIQEKIIQNLENLDNQILKRRHQSRLLLNLVKSRFNELFGDLFLNEFKWDYASFNEFAKFDTKMISDFTNFIDLPHIGIDSIEKNTGKLIGYRTVGEDQISSGKYLFTKKHIIYSKIRPNLNKVALPDFMGVCSADAYPILTVEEKMNRIFLAHVLRSDYFLNFILSFSSRTNLPKVNKSQISKFKCPLPPLSLQNEFADFVAQVDKSQFACQMAIKLWRNSLKSSII